MYTLDEATDSGSTTMLWNGREQEMPTYRIRDLETQDKPREKMAKYGPSILTLQELLMVVFGRGTRKEDVVGMAHRVVRDYGEQVLASGKNPSSLSEELDIPITHAAQIVACAEIGRRLFGKQPHGSVVIREPRDVFDHLRDMGRLPKEHLRGLYLNVRNQVIHEEVLSIGTVGASIIHPREVFRPALTYAAVAVVLAHNHPSGAVLPSDDDRMLTEQVRTAGGVMGIPLLDHVIITENDFHSIISD